PRDRRDVARMLQQRRPIDVPVHLRPARETRHRVRLDPHAPDPQLPALHHRRPRPTERVEHRLPRPQPEAPDIVPDQVRRERQHNPVPVVRAAILRPDPVVLPRRRCHSSTRAPFAAVLCLLHVLLYCCPTTLVTLTAAYNPATSSLLSTRAGYA